MADAQATAILNFGGGKFDRLVIDKKTAADDLQIGDFLKQAGIEDLRSLGFV